MLSAVKTLSLFSHFYEILEQIWAITRSENYLCAAYWTYQTEQKRLRDGGGGWGGGGGGGSQNGGRPNNGRSEVIQ